MLGMIREERSRDDRKDFTLGMPRLGQLDKDLITLIAQQVVLGAQIALEICVDLEPGFFGFQSPQPEFQPMGRLDGVPDGFTGGEWFGFGRFERQDRASENLRLRQIELHSADPEQAYALSILASDDQSVEAECKPRMVKSVVQRIAKSGKVVESLTVFDRSQPGECLFGS